MAARRGIERQKNQNLLREIGRFYQLFQTEMGRPPAHLAEFLAYIQRDARNEHQALQEGRLVMVFSPNLTPNMVLAYERDVDYNGNRLVLLGDGNSVRLISNAEFQASGGR